MKQSLWPEWATFKCPFCEEEHQVRLASDSLNGPFDEDGNQSPDLVDFAFCPRGEMDSPLVVALGAYRRVLKESATVPFSFEDTGSQWSEVMIRENPPK